MRQRVVILNGKFRFSSWTYETVAITHILNLIDCLLTLLLLLLLLLLFCFRIPQWNVWTRSYCKLRIKFNEILIAVNIILPIYLIIFFDMICWEMRFLWWNRWKDPGCIRDECSMYWNMSVDIEMDCSGMNVSIALNALTTQLKVLCLWARELSMRECVFALNTKHTFQQIFGGIDFSIYFTINE